MQAKILHASYIIPKTCCPINFLWRENPPNLWGSKIYFIKVLVLLALICMKYTSIGGLHLLYSWLGGQSQKASTTGSSRNLWISGLSSSTRATDLKQLFSKHGKVSNTESGHCTSYPQNCCLFVQLTCVWAVFVLEGSQVSTKNGAHHPLIVWMT